MGRDLQGYPAATLVRARATELSPLLPRRSPLFRGPVRTLHGRRALLAAGGDSSRGGTMPRRGYNEARHGGPHDGADPINGNCPQPRRVSGRRGSWERGGHQGLEGRPLPRSARSIRPTSLLVTFTRRDPARCDSTREWPSSSACHAGPPRTRCATAGSTSRAIVATSPGVRSSPRRRSRYFPSRPKARTVASRLRVLYEDRHVLIVDKPAGLLTLPTPGPRARDPGRPREPLPGDPAREPRPFVGVVHRLDKDTSGALALARSPEAVRAFQALFKAHDIERQYLAVVEGASPARKGRSTWTWSPTAATCAAASPAARAKGGPRSPTTASSSASARSPPCWPAGSRPAGPTRSASIWPRSATPSSATPSTGPASGRVPRRSSPARPSTPRPWASSTP